MTNAIELIGCDPRLDKAAHVLNRLGGNLAGGPDLGYLDWVLHVATGVFGRRFLAHIFWTRNACWNCTDWADAPRNKCSSAGVPRHGISLFDVTDSSSEAHAETGDLDPAKAWWYNLKKLRAEQGLKSAAVYRVGPFATKADAEMAPILLRERSKAWQADDAKDN